MSSFSKIDTSKKFQLGTRKRQNGKEYIYLQGVTSCVVGSWVTFDEAGVTTLLAANAIGPVAVSMSANASTTNYSWFQVFGLASALLAANCADNASLGRETTDGYAGDGRAAGDQMLGAISRGSTSGAAALTTVHLYYPSVNDITGS